MLVMPDGPSRRVGPSGVLIGRQKDCDIVALDPSVSRRHALVRITAEGAEVVPLGREPIAINGKPSDKPQLLADGDTLGIPGLTLSVQIEAQPVAIVDEDKRGRVMSLYTMAFFGMVPFGSLLAGWLATGVGTVSTIFGGGATDDLIVKKWPEALLQLQIAQGELFVELRAGKAEHNAQALEAGVLEPLTVGDVLTCLGETFTIHHARGRDAATTAVSSMSDLPIKAEIELLPRGGRIVFTLAIGERAVYLSDRRFDLMMALLRPPEGQAAGEFVTDDAVRSIVWPRNPAVSRPEINMLISRCRKDLVDAGLAGPRLIERAPGGGGTRITLAPRAVVVVKT